MKIFFLIFSFFVIASKNTSFAAAAEPADYKTLHRSYVRLSVVTGPNKDHWKATRNIQRGPGFHERLKAAVLSEDRLETHFKTFETICLPSLMAVRCPPTVDHKVVIITSNHLPEAYKERLNHLVELNKERLEVTWCSLTDSFVSRIDRQLKNLLSTGRYTHLMTSRIDDDDALPPNFLEALVEDAPSLSWNGFISYPQGIFLDLDRDFQARYGVKYWWKNGSCGITSVRCVKNKSAVGGKTNIFQHGNHIHLNSRTFQRPLMFLRGGHGANDFGVQRRGDGVAKMATIKDRHLPYDQIKERFSLTVKESPDYNKL